MKVNEELIDYIEKEIFPSYKKNELGHDLNHIKEVIERSFKFASKINDINYDMVYTIASYHDIGHYLDAKNHEKISADMLFQDKNLKKYFTDEQIRIMSDAVYDHKSTLNGNPRSIYGKIISSADRPTKIETALKRTYYYTVAHYPSITLEQVIELSRQHLIDKFGEDNGFAKDKMYFEDEDYLIFLENISNVTKDKEKFKKILLNYLQ